MLPQGFVRVTRNFSAVVALTIAVAGCGTPSNLDHQEQVAFARGCASLVERGMSQNKPPRVAQLGGEDLNLDDPPSFYSVLERLRGPSTYDLHDSKHSGDTARQPLDGCDTKPRSLNSLFAKSTTTTTTTTSTVPGS